MCKVENCDRSPRAKGLCNNHYVQQWRRNNPERARAIDRKHRENHSDRMRDRHIKSNRLGTDKRRQWLDGQKNKPCVDCGGRFPSICMDFDHRDPGWKFDTVSRMLLHNSLQKVIDEIKKCDLVCANCHRVRTKSVYIARRKKALHQ